MKNKNYLILRASLMESNGTSQDMECNPITPAMLRVKLLLCMLFTEKPGLTLCCIFTAEGQQGLT